MLEAKIFCHDNAYEPRSSVLFASEINEVFIATDSKLDNALFAPPRESAVMQSPFCWKQPPVNTMPLANVLDTVAEVIFKADALTPALKVLVVLPNTVIMVEET